MELNVPKIDPQVSQPSASVTQPWKSKTLWVSAIMAVAPLFPPVAAVVAAQPEAVSTAVGVIFFILRLVTDTKVSMKK